MKLLAITTPPRPQSDTAAARNVARRNAGRPSTVPMLANTTAHREASVVATRAARMAGMFWTFVDATEVVDRRVVIEGLQGHHLARVLRIRPGERVIAVQAERSVARPAPQRLARWQAIASSAAEQSHRGAVPEIVGPAPLAPALPQAGGARLLVLDPSGSLPLVQAIDGSDRYTMAVGPEGGWTDPELSLMRERGGVAVNLGPRILRARLASVVAAAILVQQR